MDTSFPNLGASSTSSSIPVSLPSILLGTLFSTLAYITHFQFYNFEKLNLNDYNTLNLNDFNTLTDTCEFSPSSNSPNENWDNPTKVVGDGIGICEQHN